MSAANAQETVAQGGGQTWSWGIDPVPGWVVVPSTVTEAPEAVREWEQKTTESVLEFFEGDLAEAADGAETEPLSAAEREQMGQAATLAVASLREFADDVARDGARVAAALGVRNRGAVPVLVTVVTSERGAPDDDLMAVLGVKGGSPVNPPDVEYLDLPDGDGIRATRLDVDPASGGVWVSVALCRRTEHPDAVVDTVLLWRTQDIAIIETVGEALDELLSAVRITRSGQ